MVVVLYKHEGFLSTLTAWCQSRIKIHGTAAWVVPLGNVIVGHAMLKKRKDKGFHVQISIPKKIKCWSTCGFTFNATSQNDLIWWIALSSLFALFKTWMHNMFWLSASRPPAIQHLSGLLKSAVTFNTHWQLCSTVSWRVYIYCRDSSTR